MASNSERTGRCPASWRLISAPPAWRRLAACALVVLLALAPRAAQANRYGPQMAAGTADVGVTPRPNAQLPLDATFVDHTGKSVRLADYFNRGRPVILSLVYFDCPMLCGVTLEGIRNGIADGPRGLMVGRDYDIVTLSFDPTEKHDLAASKRKSYLEALGKPKLEGGWHFLTGDYTQIHRVTSTVGFSYRQDPETKEYLHASAIFVCTPQGRVAQTIGGVNFSEPDVSLHDQLVRASEGKIGGGMLNFALTCGLMKFDAETGRFVHNKWMWAGTVGGMLILLTFGTYFGSLWYGEYRRSHEEAPKDKTTRTDGGTEKGQGDEV